MLTLDDLEPLRTLYNAATTHFHCSFEEYHMDGRTDAHTRSPLLGLLSEPKIEYLYTTTLYLLELDTVVP